LCYRAPFGWEPGTKRQHASEVYERRFGPEGHSNQDISKVPTAEIPDHDLLVGGFPCQDYSVAATLNRSGGIQGKKGVLWWQIHRILQEKGEAKPRYLFLENVDRLLKSPARQRGRDFAIMLASLSDLGYAVEWRIINAADYGMPQRRRRIFIMGYLKGSPPRSFFGKLDSESMLLHEGVLAKAFPVVRDVARPGAYEFHLEGGLSDITKKFGKDKGEVFENSGIMVDRKVLTFKVSPKYKGSVLCIRDILQEKPVDEEYFIDAASLGKWEYLKGSKSYDRTSKEGFTYKFSEGGMVFPDPMDKPCRTIITGEGGASPSRFKHVIKDPSARRFRRLTPLELERANMFPDNHTGVIPDISDQKRAFFMGNALVVGVIERIGVELGKLVGVKTKKKILSESG
jgi:DNA (cytosine-5)-methyltransferase 1